MKRILISICFFYIALICEACDLCNCYSPINPLVQKNYIGLRSQVSKYTGTYLSDAEMNSLSITENDFREIKSEYELHGQFHPLKRFQLIFSVPYISNTEYSRTASPSHIHSHTTTANHDDEKNLHETIQGIGDPLIILSYQVMNKNNFDTLALKQTLFIGAGIKLPFGANKISETESDHKRSHLPGTGSYDYLVTLNYMAKIKSAGISANVNYLLAGVNEQLYRYGNRFNGKLSAFYEIKGKSLSVFPFLGFYTESAGYDEFHNQKIFNTGGAINYSQAGIDLYCKNLSVSAELQLPVIQNMNGFQPEIRYRIISGVKYSFN
jgi:hypothetical protein